MTRQQLEENICEVWNPKERLSATTDRSTATPEICLATNMSSRNSLKSGDFPIQPAHRSILNQMPKLKEPYRPQNALLRRLQQRPIWGTVKVSQYPFEDIGVSPAQLLMSRRTRTVIPTHQCLLLPQPVDRDHLLKTLHQRQHNANSNYDKQSRDLCRFVQMVKGNGAKLK